MRSIMFVVFVVLVAGRRYIHIFGISYELFFFCSSSCLSLARSLNRLCVRSLGRTGVPTMFLEICFFFFSFRLLFATRFCIIAFSCARASDSIHAVFFPRLLSKQKSDDLLSIDDD